MSNKRKYKLLEGHHSRPEQVDDDAPEARRLPPRLDPATGQFVPQPAFRRVRYGPGDVLELTEAEAHSLGSRVAPATAEDERMASAKRSTESVISQSPNAVAAGIPQNPPGGPAATPLPGHPPPTARTPTVQPSYPSPAPRDVGAAKGDEPAPASKGPVTPRPAPTESEERSTKDKK